MSNSQIFFHSDVSLIITFLESHPETAVYYV